ncbi:MAG: PKD domain-containing protein [Solirubrobacteraceae bacterium]
MLRRALLLTGVSVLAAAGPAAARINPVAALSGPATVKAGQKATFDASTSRADPSGSIVEFAWDLDGDGTFDEIRQGPRITIVPEVPGEQVIVVRITDDAGARSTTEGHYLVEGQPPVARVDVPSSVTAGAPVTLDGSGSSSESGDIVAYAWNVDGDGFGPESADPTLTTVFAAGGTHTVVLRVRDAAQGQGTLRVPIEVAEPGGPAALGGSPELGIAPLDTLAQRWIKVGSPRRFAAIGGAARRRIGAVRRGLWVNVLADRAARFDLAVHVRRADARRLGLRGPSVLAGYVRVAHSSYRLRVAGQRAFKLVLPRSVRRKLRAPVSLLVRGTATDGHGNRSRVSRSFALRR